MIRENKAISSSIFMNDNFVECAFMLNVIFNHPNPHYTNHHGMLNTDLQRGLSNTAEGSQWLPE